MKYRPHRGQLSDSMDEMVELKDRAALVEHLRADLAKWGVVITDADVKVEPYGRDDRVHWDTHIVTIRNKPLIRKNGETLLNRKTGEPVLFFNMGPDYFGAVGFTDGPA